MRFAAAILLGLALLTQEAMAETYPEVELRNGVGDFGTLLSIDKARRQLGYEPAFSWRDAITS